MLVTLLIIGAVVGLAALLAYTCYLLVSSGSPAQDDFRPLVASYKPARRRLTYLQIAPP